MQLTGNTFKEYSAHYFVSLAIPLELFKWILFLDMIQEDVHRLYASTTPFYTRLELPWILLSAGDPGTSLLHTSRDDNISCRLFFQTYQIKVPIFCLPSYYFKN